jgi:hypothetical protein
VWTGGSFTSSNCTTGLGASTCQAAGYPLSILTGDASDHVTVHGTDFETVYIEAVSVTAGKGNDRISIYYSYGIVFAGNGDDEITVPYGGGSVECGPGRDTATVRVGVSVSNCETVIRV